MYNMDMKGSVIYLEVPYEQPFSFSTLSKRIAQQDVVVFLRPHLFFLMFKPGMLTHMHEHVNYFSEKSVNYLLENIGFKDIQVKMDIINNARFLCAFARK